MYRSVTTPGRLQSLRGVVFVRVNSTVATPNSHDTEWDKAKPVHEIPGPKQLPILGNFWRFLPFFGEYYGMGMTDLHRKVFQQYGKLSRFPGIPGRKPIIFVYDPESAEHVYRNEGIWPIRDALKAFSYYREVHRKDFFQGNTGALVTQGEEWGKFRSIVNQPMMQPRVAKFYVGPIDEVADDFVKRIPMLRDANGEMPDDFLNEFYKWALESISMIALDTRLGCLEGKLDPNSEAQKMIQSAHDIFETLFITEAKLPFWTLFSTPTWRKFERSMDYITEVSMKYVTQAMERIKTLPEDHEPSVLERILSRDPNPKTAAVMALDMMFAGIDTTSNAIVFLLYHLAINPDVQRKLQAEIDTVLPRSNKQPITAENLNELKYLKACIKESMRISPVVIVTIRTTTKDIVLRGHQIPSGSDVALGHGTMSKMAEHYPEPDKFIPERWLKTDDTSVTTSEKKANPFAYLPFGFGVRSCVGRRFAELEMEILVTKIMRQYTVEWHHPPMKVDSMLLNTAASPLKFKMIDRN